MSSRYYDSHNNGEEIRPGRISSELRAALNLAEHDLPIWIYRMRALGYPPGWLKKAVVDTSDIFDTETSTANDGESKKRKNPSEETDVQYDLSKFIEYPGFNTPMPKNCFDYHYYFSMPGMLPHQQLDFAKKQMNAFKPAQIPKRIKTTSSADTSNSLLDESNNASSTAIDPTNSSSVLEGPESPDVSRTDDDVDDDDDGHVASTSKATDTSRLSTTSLPEAMKLVSKGSPMPKPVERAPLEKFSEGVVGELLYFENIPNSTGKFQNIRGLLNTIRRSKSENDTSFQSTKSDS